MQPLISPVDHESRHNSNRAEDDPELTPNEDTPLLQRFPLDSITEERNFLTTASVIVLLIILVFGVIIGIYLLILQMDAENILPPVESPLTLVSRSQWNSEKALHSALTMSPFMANKVIVVQTDTKQCQSMESCSKLLQDMEAAVNDSQNSLPYNFLVSSNGQTFEALGWRRPSTLFPQYSNSALVLAFIGNYTEVSPTQAQIMGAKNFFAESISQRHLEPSFSVVGKKTIYMPKYLFLSMKQLPQWDSELSDF